MNPEKVRDLIDELRTKINALEDELSEELIDDEEEEEDDEDDDEEDELPE